MAGQPLAVWCLAVALCCGPARGLLYPRDSESREIKSLDGVWSFRLDANGTGVAEGWFQGGIASTGPVIPMPVPASYNDVTQLEELRDYFGLAWYERRFFVPNSWQTSGTRVWLRFGSVDYSAQVWVNGQLAATHAIGHLPFEADVTSLLVWGAANRLTVAVDNTLTATTIPQGSTETLNTVDGTRTYQTYTFDFFNYAGIQRPVQLYTTPAVYVSDINVTTDYSADSGIGAVQFSVQWSGDAAEAPTCVVTLLDADETEVAVAEGLEGQLAINDASAWWPYLMNDNPGYLYTLVVTLSSTEQGTGDVYRLPVGIRRLTWDNSSLLINDRPVYLRGFGRHEDSDIRGKGLDLPTVARDYNLLAWLGANSYRTSHYPYAEEIMDFADQQGIMIIDECSAVNIENYSDELLENHKQSLTELIARDKNRPSVIIWSVANEPRSDADGTEDYYSEIINHVKSLDSTRPTTIAMIRDYNADRAGQFLDIIGVNRYDAWYSDEGKTEVIVPNLLDNIPNWRAKYNKPIIMTEYGADTMPGYHSLPNYIWSEEYQQVILAEHFKAFDELRQTGYFIGEMIWNFADFKTAETYTRVGGNKKGIFTRSREPKSSAYLVRRRYWGLAGQLDGAEQPDDLDLYTVG